MAEVRVVMRDGPLMKRLPRLARLLTESVRRTLREELTDFVSQFTQRRLTRRGAASVGVRTGRLRRGLRHEVTGGRVREVAGRVWFDMPRELESVPIVHEEGATIRPRRAQYLAVPLKAAMTAAGVLRRPPRDWPNTFVIPSKGPKAKFLIVRRRGRGIEPLFALVDSVTIPARLNFRADFDKARRQAVRRMRRDFSRTIRTFARGGA